MTFWSKHKKKYGKKVSNEVNHNVLQKTSISAIKDIEKGIIG